MPDILTAHIRGLKTAQRNTGTHTVSYEVSDDNTMTFEGKNRAGKASIKGTVTADGTPTVKRLSGAKAPKAAKASEEATESE